jgi:hypothetical protein
MSVQNILQRNYTPGGLAGPRGDKLQLRAELQACVQLNSKLYAFLIGLVFLLFAAAVWAVGHDLLLGGTRYVGVLAGLGITATGSIELMRRIGREWSQARLLLALVGAVSEGEMQGIIGKLLDGKQLAG